MKIGAVAYPSETLLLMEIFKAAPHSADVVHFDGEYSSNVANYAMRHNNRMNVVMVGGNLTNLSVHQLIVPSNRTHNTLPWNCRQLKDAVRNY
jgi:prepilin-type processing-associated H-X9-DG protein